MEYTSVYRMEQAVAMSQTASLETLYEGHPVKIHEISGQLLWRGDFVDSLIAVVLVSNLENIGVFSAVPMVVGTVVVLVAAMMNGNFQSRRIDQKHRQGQQGDYCFYRSFHPLYFNGAKLRKNFLSFSIIPKKSPIILL
jgi:hypothetical protein